MPRNVAVFTEDQLAKHWGVSARYVRMMADEDIAVRKDGRGYDVIASDSRLIGWLRRDEASKRIKREYVAMQIQAKEQQMQRNDRKWLTFAEVRGLIDECWSALWNGHLALLNRWHSEFHYLAGPDRADQAWRMVDEDVKGQLRLASQRLEDLYAGALAKMDCELRNGILVSSRRIRALSAALGEDDSEEARDYRRRVGLD